MKQKASGGMRTLRERKQVASNTRLMRSVRKHTLRSPKYFYTITINMQFLEIKIQFKDSMLL